MSFFLEVEFNIIPVSNMIELAKGPLADSSMTITTTLEDNDLKKREYDKLWQATDLLKLPPPFHTLSLTHKHTLRPPSLPTTQPSKRVRGVTPCLFLSLGVCRLQSGGWRARYSSNRLQFETGFKSFS
ncbi:hypothetical protein L1887_11181 [Cichorium endivia]|nr:hypothetical protein L1887_11181 [Cichorium endivia]